MSKNNEFVGIDIFSGAGGLSLGAMSAGIDVRCAIEKDKFAAETFKRNHPDSIVIIKDIQQIKPKEISQHKPFIIFGGPPCQGFSFSNTKTRNSENKNNHLFKEFIRFVKDLKPEWFLFENVEGIAKFEKGRIVEMIKNSFEKLGYTVAFSVLHASDYGVPQNRSRFIMVGNMNGINFEFPKKDPRKVSVKEAIADLPTLENGEMSDILPYKNRPSLYAKKCRNGMKKSLQNYVSKNRDNVIERYRHIAPGQNWEAIPDELMSNYKNKKNCHSGIYRRLDPTKPSVVISNYRKNMLIHPYENRGLSVREAARLQSFPDSFVFEGSINHIQQQIGNAVPPLLAEKIFKQIVSEQLKYGF